MGNSNLRRRFWVVIRPGLRGGSSGSSSVGGSLGLRSLGRLLDFDPLLGSSQVVSLVRRIPLLLCSCVGSAVTDVRVRNRGLALALGLSRSSVDMTVCEGSIGTGVDLSQACVGNSGIGLAKLGLSSDDRLSLGRGLGLVQGGRVGGCLLLYSRNYSMSARCRHMWEPLKLTGCLQRLTRHTCRGIVSALVQFDHGSHSRLVTTVDTQQDALESHVLISVRVWSLATSVGSQTQELGDHQETILKGLLSILLRLALGLSNRISPLLLELLRQLFLRFSFDGGERRPPLVVNLLKLSQLLLVPG